MEQGSLFNDEQLESELVRLKNFMLNHFDFYSFKKAGFYPKDMKANDYKGQAEIICKRLGLESIYEYLREPFNCHISYADPKPKPNEIPRYRQFVETIGGLKPLNPEAKIIPFNKKDS